MRAVAPARRSFGSDAARIAPATGSSPVIVSALARPKWSATSPTTGSISDATPQAKPIISPDTVLICPGASSCA